MSQALWSSLPGKPFVTVSALGISNGGSAATNNGADFGPDTPGTTTSGIQDALDSIASTGGTIVLLTGVFSNVGSPLHNTGPNQVVWCNPGCTIEFSSSTTPIQVLDTNVLILLGSNNNYASPPISIQNWSNNFWYGNGAIIKVNGAGLNATPNATVFGITQAGAGWNGAPPSTSNLIHAGWGFEIDGFVLDGVPGSSFFVDVSNYLGFTGVDHYYVYQVRNVRISRIYATYDSLNTTGASGFVVQGSVRQALLENLEIDVTDIPASSSVSPSNCFIRSNAGETSQVVVRQSRFVNNASNNYITGQVLEMQGNPSSLNSGPSDNHALSIEDCVFDLKGKGTGPSGAFFGEGHGGGEMDDHYNRSGTYGAVYNLSFDRCTFGKYVGISIDSNEESVFGYLRFTDGTNPGGVPGLVGTSGSLTGRGPHDQGIDLTSSPLVPINLSNNTLWTNTLGVTIRVLISGGVMSQSIQVNGQSTGLNSGEFVIREGDTIRVSWTTAPSVVAQAL